MLGIITRARKDAKAASHALNRKVESLGGVRSADSIDISQYADKIPVFLFGRNETELARDIAAEIRKYTPIYAIEILRTKEVRNARLEEIRRAFENAKARIRLGFDFDEAFVFSVSNRMGIEIHPDYDAYFAMGDGFKENLKALGVEVGDNPLVIRKLYNEEWYYSPELKAIVSKKIGEDIRVRTFESTTSDASIDSLIEKNREWMQKLEEISIDFIRSHFDSACVPFSGGKDSTAALILAKKAIDDVKAIYVKTSHDMPFTDEYVNYIIDKLGVELVTVKVNFDIEKYGMPTIENRWCTGLKLKALESAVTSSIIVGDRDAESRVRRLRPEVIENTRKEIFPIKYWSGAMVQLYILMNGLKLHPLYYEGFYRLGCTICPSLSEWEEMLLRKYLR